MISLPLTNIYSYGRKIYLFTRSGDKLSILQEQTFFPYFYELSNSSKGVFRTIDGKKVQKVFCKEPHQIKQKRTETSYEADVIYIKRFLIDKVSEITKTKIKYFFIDIEVTANELPNSNNPIYTINCISLYNSMYESIHTWFLKDYQGTELEQEDKLLTDFTKYIKKEQPDILTGWNFINFDYAYLFKRIQKLWNVNFADFISPIEKARYGIEDIMYPAGISILDYLDLFKKIYNKETSYALDSIAQKYLKTTPNKKVDFSIVSEEIKEKNIKDIEKMVALEKDKQIINYYDEIRRMGKCLWEDLTWYSKVLDVMLLTEAKQKGIVLPSKNYDNNEDESNFEGAYRRSENGFYKDLWKLDLSSAYPMAISNFCLDISNLTENKAEQKIDITDRETNKILESIYMKQNPEALLPTMARKLIAKKDILKNKLKSLNPETPEAKDLQTKYDATKALVNSLFGVCGLKVFRLFNNQIASAITSIVRDLLHYVEDKLKEQGMKVIYIDTDSCAKDTPITIKTPKGIEILPIEDLFAAPKTNTNSRFDISHKNYKIWTDKGWSKIKYVYRHKTKKLMYRILTRKGLIEISEDHSLIINNKSISPIKLKIGDKLEQYPIKLEELYNIDIDIAWLIGFWLAEGSCGNYKKIKKISWHLDNQKIEFLLQAQSALLKLGIATKIIDCRKSSSTYRLVSDGHTKILYELFNFWCLTKTGTKKIPSFILSANKEAKQSFLKGLWQGDGYIGIKDKIESITSIDKSLMQGVISILDSLGFDYSLIIRPDKINVVALRIIRNIKDKRIRKPDEIIKIEKYYNNTNIYDIETENHHFCGGLGQINLHNSVFVEAKENPTELLNKLVKQWGKDHYNKDNIEIEFDYEGKFDKLLIVALCHYVGYLRKVDGKIKHEIKGVEIKRKDSSKFMKDFQSVLIEKILNEEPEKEIITFIQAEKERIKTVPLTEIGFPCKINTSKTYKSPPIFMRAYKYTKTLIPFDKTTGDIFYYIYVKSFGEAKRISKRNLKNKETGKYEERVSETTIAKNVLAFDEDNYEHIKDIDWKKIISRTITEKCKHIFEALNWDIKQINFAEEVSKKTCLDSIKESGVKVANSAPKYKQSISDNLSL